jgi:hypothetical protein
MMEINNHKLPPKPQQQPSQQPQQMYKLPPKPQGNYNPTPPPSGRPSSNHSNNVNRSYDEVRRSQSREKLPTQPPQTPVVNRSKDNLNINNNLLNRQQPSTNSRENLLKNVPQSRTPQQRPSSAQRPQIQPSWWG